MAEYARHIAEADRKGQGWAAKGNRSQARLKFGPLKRATGFTEGRRNWGLIETDRSLGSRLVERHVQVGQVESTVHVKPINELSRTDSVCRSARASSLIAC